MQRPDAFTLEVPLFPWKLLAIFCLAVLYLGSWPKCFRHQRRSHHPLESAYGRTVGVPPGPPRLFRRKLRPDDLSADEAAMICPSSCASCRRRSALPPLDEAAAYARCHGNRDNDVRIVKLPPRRPRLRGRAHDRRGAPRPLRGTARRARDRQRSRTSTKAGPDDPLPAPPNFPLPPRT